MNFQKILPFLNENPNPLLVIYGPTWCGKTGMSIQIAQFLENSWFFPFIISVDSRQIYREMNIGTGKITEKEKQNILHIWLDIINANETFSVVDFQKSIDNCPIFENWKKFWKNFENKKIIPIICGGTGLYIDSLIFERNYLGSEPNPARRKELEDFRQKFWNEALWQKLYQIDPKYASELHPNNHTYIIRGIEIFEETGKSKLESIDEKLKLRYPTLFLTPYSDSEENRKILYEKINTRIEEMFESGLVKEVEKILQKFGRKAIWLTTIWYKEVVEYLEWKISLTEAKNLVAQHNRNYAKRQITWNRKKYDIFWKNF